MKRIRNGYQLRFSLVRISHNELIYLPWTLSRCWRSVVTHGGGNWTTRGKTLTLDGLPLICNTLTPGFDPGMASESFNQCLLTVKRFSTGTKKSKWVWSGNTTITNCRQPRGTARKSRSTITRHQEDKLSKAISSLFPIKMIAILEWT